MSKRIMAVLIDTSQFQELRMFMVHSDGIFSFSLQFVVVYKLRNQCTYDVFRDKAVEGFNISCLCQDKKIKANLSNNFY